jgi:hypothetical protein
VYGPASRVGIRESVDETVVRGTSRLPLPEFMLTTTEVETTYLHMAIHYFSKFKFLLAFYSIKRHHCSCLVLHIFRPHHYQQLLTQSSTVKMCTPLSTEYDNSNNDEWSAISHSASAVGSDQVLVDYAQLYNSDVPTVERILRSLTFPSPTGMDELLVDYSQLYDADIPTLERIVASLMLPSYKWVYRFIWFGGRAIGAWYAYFI